jgi:hypothetical protein
MELLTPLENWPRVYYCSFASALLQIKFFCYSHAIDDRFKIYQSGGDDQVLSFIDQENRIVQCKNKKNLSDDPIDAAEK